MKSGVQMSDAKTAMVVSALGIVCFSMCAGLWAIPLLRTLAMVAIAKTQGGMMLGAWLGAGIAIRGIWLSGRPAWLRILSGVTAVPFFALLLVVEGVMGAWFLLVIAFSLVVAWLAMGRPHLPTWKEFNRG